MLRRLPLTPCHLYARGYFCLGNHLVAYWDHSSQQHLNRLATTLDPHLNGMIQRCCYHYRHHGGTKGALRLIMRQLPEADFVARFDIKQYYRSMSHKVILKLCEPFNLDKSALDLLKQFLCTPDPDTLKGIAAGNRLAPLLGALVLAPLDKAMTAWRRKKKIVGYCRYMDDIVILCNSRWSLRRAIKRMHAILDTLDLTVHRDKKRMIGRTSKGFDFLGYQLQQGKRLRPSKEAIRRFRTRMTGLMSKEPERLRSYIAHWQQYYFAGLPGIISLQGGLNRTIKRAVYYIKQQQIIEPP